MRVRFALAAVSGGFGRVSRPSGAGVGGGLSRSGRGARPTGSDVSSGEGARGSAGSNVGGGNGLVGDKNLLGPADGFCRLRLGSDLAVYLLATDWAPGYSVKDIRRSGKMSR